MRLGEITGNETLILALQSMLRSGRIPHSIMLHEDDGGGALPIVQAFLEDLFDEHNRIPKYIHPDVHYIFPSLKGKPYPMEEFRQLCTSNPRFVWNEFLEGMGYEGKLPSIGVELAGDIIHELGLSPLEGGMRAVVVYLPEKMNQEASNKLLKSIEEPPSGTQFILITHAPDRVLKTISSRCQQYRVLPSGVPAAFSASSQDFELLLCSMMDALLSRDLYALLDAGQAVANLPSRESVKSFCKFASEAFRQIFLIQQGVQQLTSPSNLPLRQWAAALRKQFPRQGLDSLSRAQLLVERNVNLKIIMTDLCDRLYIKL